MSDIPMDHGVPDMKFVLWCDDGELLIEAVASDESWSIEMELRDVFEDGVLHPDFGMRVANSAVARCLRQLADDLEAGGAATKPD